MKYLPAVALSVSIAAAIVGTCFILSGVGLGFLPLFGFGAFAYVKYTMPENKQD